MTITKLKYEGNIEDTDLYNMATFYGWKANIPNPEYPANPDAPHDIPNPQSYQTFACLDVLGMKFIIDTVNSCCEPLRESTIPKDYPTVMTNVKTNILATTIVSMNDVIIYPTNKI